VGCDVVHPLRVSASDHGPHASSLGPGESSPGGFGYCAGAGASRHVRGTRRWRGRTSWCTCSGPSFAWPEQEIDERVMLGQAARAASRTRWSRASSKARQARARDERAAMSSGSAGSSSASAGFEAVGAGGGERKASAPHRALRGPPGLRHWKALGSFGRTGATRPGRARGLRGRWRRATRPPPHQLLGGGARRGSRDPGSFA